MPPDPPSRPPGSPTSASVPTRVTDEHYMAMALQFAAEAAAAGEVPVGAVAVASGRVVATGANRREATQDPTDHAEMVCLRAAAAATGAWRLSGLTVYVTLEPCPMCAGALLAARVSRVVFAAADPKSGACGSLYNLLADPRLNHEPALTAGVMAEAASRLLGDFFAACRA